MTVTTDAKDLCVLELILRYVAELRDGLVDDDEDDDAK